MKKSGDKKPIDQLKIKDLKINKRIKTALKKNDIIYFSQIANLNMLELKELQCIGKIFLDETSQLLSSVYFNSQKFYSLYDELRRIAKKNGAVRKFDSETLAKLLIPCCNSKVTDQEIFDKIKLIITEELFEEKVSIKDKFLFDFIEEEKERAVLREKFGITKRKYFKISEF